MIAAHASLLVALAMISCAVGALALWRPRSGWIPSLLTCQAIGACSPVFSEISEGDERVPCREVVSLPSKGSDVAILSLEDRDGQDCACFVDPPEANASIVMTFDADACACAGVLVGSQPGRLRLEGDCEAP